MPLDASDNMKTPELTREVRSLRHNFLQGRPHLQTMYGAGVNHAIKLDIHAEFLELYLSESYA